MAGDSYFPWLEDDDARLELGARAIALYVARASCFVWFPSPPPGERKRTMNVCPELCRLSRAAPRYGEGVGASGPQFGFDAVSTDIGMTCGTRDVALAAAAGRAASGAAVYLVHNEVSSGDVLRMRNSFLTTNETITCVYLLPNYVA